MSRTQLGILAVVAVVATRLVIGWHFYKEGTNKLTAENWTAAPVLAQAKGDFAGPFKSLTPQRYASLDLLRMDADEEKKLYDKEKREEIAAWRAEMEERYNLDFSRFTIEPTVQRWWYEGEELGDHYGFGNKKLEEKIAEERAKTRAVLVKLLTKMASLDESGSSPLPTDIGELRKRRGAVASQIEKARDSLLSEAELSDATPEARKANDAKRAKLDRLENEFKALDKEFLQQEKLYKKQEQQILAIRNQLDATGDLIDAWQEQLELWIVSNYEAIDEYFDYKQRIAKNSADPVRQEVATLESQAATIEADMRKVAGPLVAGVANIWDGLNADLNRLAVASQAEKGKYVMVRPDQAPERLALINKFIPWFDTIIGALLILGLFTRPAAIAAAGFLLSVILMQPPWVDGAVPTYYQAVELFALLMLAAVGAGRYAGLDFFLRCLYYRIFPPKSAEMVRYESQRPISAETVDTPAQNAEPITV